MKKLIVAASAVALSFAVNAGSYSWGFPGGTGDTSPEGEWYEGAKAFLYLGDVSFSSETGWNLASATLINSSVYDGEMGYGAFDSSALPENASIDIAGGQDYSLVLVYDASVTDLASYVGEGKYYYIETGVSGTITEPTATGSITYATMLSEEYVMGDMWQSAATSVPEPTSGLLLLLGVAGLALKRRRA